MARRRPKIPRTTAFRVPFELGSSVWDRIEQASYGESFSPQLRDEVVKITKEFLYWSSAEQTPPLRDAQKRARDLRKFTASLLKEIQRKTDVSAYTNELIGVCFRKFWRKKTKSIPVAEWDAIPSEVTKALSSFLRACDEALSQMKALSPKIWMWEDGEAWNRWVVQLSDLAENNGFPIESSISRRKLDPGKASPFVRFVDQLQATIPEKYRRHRQSLVALAQAIKRAREHGPRNTIAKNPKR
jgi:hypothetical protein